MKHLAIIFIFLALLFTVTTSACSETVVVSAENYKFVPDVVTIKKGDTVKWKIEGTFHSTTSGTNCEPDGIWDSEVLGFGDEYSKQFDKPGTYKYFCTPHCEDFNMLGTVIVE